MKYSNEEIKKEARRRYPMEEYTLLDQWNRNELRQQVFIDGALWMQELSKQEPQQGWTDVMALEILNTLSKWSEIHPKSNESERGTLLYLQEKAKRLSQITKTKAMTAEEILNECFLGVIDFNKEAALHAMKLFGDQEARKAFVGAREVEASNDTPFGSGPLYADYDDYKKQNQL
jgi:hypothetical protein